MFFFVILAPRIVSEAFLELSAASSELLNRLRGILGAIAVCPEASWALLDASQLL